MTRIGFGLLVVLLTACTAFAETIELVRQDIRVIDGDTIAVRGHDRNVRLVGFNTPEIRNARCENEARLGVMATNRLREILNGPALDLELVRCSCRSGTHGTKRCNFGRACGVLRADGKDVGDILIQEGLAVPFQCGTTRCPRTPRPWCD